MITILRDFPYRVTNKFDDSFVGYFSKREDAEKVPNGIVDKEETYEIKVYESYDEYVDENFCIKVKTFMENMNEKELNLVQEILTKKKQDKTDNKFYDEM